MSARKVVSVGVTDFKRRCLALIADVEAGRIERLVLTRRGRRVAELARIRAAAKPAALWGRMRETIALPPDADLTAPIGDAWDAEADGPAA